MNGLKERLNERFDELKWLYCELYDNDTQAFDYFTKMLERAYKSRSKELRAWDEKRTLDADWFRRGDALGYVLYTDCYAGTLDGVREHLDYLEESHVNYLHLMPVMESPEGKSDGGYAVSDFRAIDPRLGTMKDLSLLTAACHDAGIHVCLDFVMNHTSEEHEWARRARAGEKEYQDRYFFFDDWSEPAEYERYLPEVFPQTAPGNFTWCGEAGKVVMTTFYPYQWDLNYHNPVVFNDMTENMLYLCNHGVDVIRLDATPYIWKIKGTNCRNLKEVHSLVRLMRLAAEIVCPGTLLLGEIVMEPKEVVPYFGSVEKPECHLLYNVTTMASIWHTVATTDVRLLAHQLETVYALPREYTFLNYLRCHDDIGWGLDYAFLKQFGVEEIAHKKFLNDYFQGYFYGSTSRGELYNDDPESGDARLCGTTASLCGLESALSEGDPLSTETALMRILTLHAFLLTQPGIPMLYSGDEIGQLNDVSYHEDLFKWDDSRYLHRGRLDWKAVAKRSKKGSTQYRLYHTIMQLRKLRAAKNVFCPVADACLATTGYDHVLGIRRTYKDQELLAYFNFKNEAVRLRIPDASAYTDLLKTAVLTDDAWELAPYGFVWLYH